MVEGLFLEGEVLPDPGSCVPCCNCLPIFYRTTAADSREQTYRKLVSLGWTARQLVAAEDKGPRPASRARLSSSYAHLPPSRPLAPSSTETPPCQATRQLHLRPL